MSNEVKTKEKIDMDPKYIVKLTVTLLGTCLIVALLLGLVNGVTADKIAAMNAAAHRSAPPQSSFVTPGSRRLSQAASAASHSTASSGSS